MKTVSAALLPIITIDRSAERPLHRQVYDAYRTAIADGTLRVAQKVPSTRVLAAELGVSRSPVLHAYAQLVAEGYLHSRVGAGTEVSKVLAERHGSWSTPRSRRATSGMRPVAKLSTLAIPAESAFWRCGGAFVVGQVANDQFPVRVWNALVTRHGRRKGVNSLDDGNPMGLRALREAIAVYVRTVRAVKCEAEQIMVVSGPLQALEVSARVLLNAGHAVWIEEPACPFARNVFTLHGCRIVSVPVDGEGLNVETGIRECGNARVALVTPSHHYPLGVTMSTSRRLRLLDWAERSGAWILEVDCDGEYRHEGKPVASLQSLDANSRVVYIGSFDKVLFPSLKLGYVVIPPDLLEPFRSICVAMDTGPPAFGQAVVADFIREGHFSRHIRRMRSLYGERRNELVENLRQALPLRVQATGGQAGMQLAVILDGINDLEVAKRAARQQLWLSPLSACYSGKDPRSGFVLGFGNVPVADISKAVHRLRAAVGFQ
jgi:GntR family transcriptional regulator/MocR family aminotransferase